MMQHETIVVNKIMIIVIVILMMMMIATGIDSGIVESLSIVVPQQQHNIILSKSIRTSYSSSLLHLEFKKGTRKQHTLSSILYKQQQQRRRFYNSNDDDDFDSIDRDMGRIGWGKTVLSESRSEITSSSVFESKRSDHSSKTDEKMIINIALTREVGKNDALATAIQNCNTMMEQNQYKIQLQSYEIPCIQHADGPDYNTLRELLLVQSQLSSNTMNNDNNNNNSDNERIIYDYIIITSPEAARVLASVWPWTRTIDNNDDTSSSSVSMSLLPPPKVAAVGKATELVLRECNINVSFVPSKATAQTLVEELPIQIRNDQNAVSSSTDDSSNNNKDNIHVLYPASAKAADVIVNGLEQQNLTSDILFHVTRLNTYDTIPTIWDSTQQQIAQSCHIITFASPSAIKGWISNIGSSTEESAIPTTTTTTTTTAIACIGETSATACRKLGKWDESITPIYYPKEQPGIDGWMDAIMEAAAYITATTLE